MAWRLTALTLLLLLAGCSSAPPAPEGVQDRKNRAADYLKFGRQAFQEAQYEQALSFYLIAVDLNTAVDYTVGMAAAWNSVATAHSALGHAAEALSALSRAETLAASSGDKTLVLQVAVNQIQAALASGDNPGAQKRLEALKPFPATAEGAALEHALGTLDKALDKPVEAAAAFDRAYSLNSTLGLKQEMASNQYMKASVLGRLGSWEEAAAALNRALDLDRIMENTVGIGQDLRALGTVTLKLNRPQEAYDTYLRAYRLFLAAGLGDQQKRTLELIIPLAGTLGLASEQQRFQTLLKSLNTAK